jgi:magnesium transporter
VADGLQSRRALRGRGPLVERRSDTIGLSQGALPDMPAGTRPARVTAFHYTPDLVEEHDGLSAADALALSGRPGVTWINIDGVDDTKTVAAFGEAFGLHPLAVEDIARTNQRPALTVYPDRVVVVVRAVEALSVPADLAYCSASTDVPGHVIEQISFVLAPGIVLSFQEDEGDVFDPVRHRIRTGGGRVRRLGADYLLAALIDIIVDQSFVTLERIGDAAETLETLALEDPAPAVQASLSRLRREVSLLRRALWPLRDVISGLARDDTPFVMPETVPFLHDAQDHLVQAVDILESLREILASVSDLYLSVVGTRQNEVMKVLTVISTVFLPLTFVAGVYGMNFDPDASPLNMPELRWFYGYPFSLGLMLAIAAGLMVFFRKKGWF